MARTRKTNGKRKRATELVRDAAKLMKREDARRFATGVRLEALLRIHVGPGEEKQ